MYSAGSQQSMQSSNVAGASSSSSTSGSNVTRPNPSPPMTPGRQQASPSPLVQQPSAPAAASLAVRGRYRELQQLNNEMQLLQEELHSLDNIPPASKACKDLVTFVESCADPFFPNSDGVAPQAWPYDRPVKASRCCWKF